MLKKYITKRNDCNIPRTFKLHTRRGEKKVQKSRCYPDTKQFKSQKDSRQRFIPCPSAI